MSGNLRRATIGFTIFLVACLIGTFALLAVFSQFRFSREQIYRAEFTDVSGLTEGDFVRIGGVEVGKVKGISITDEGLAVVEFGVDPGVVLTTATKAAVRWENPIGDRYLTLSEGVGDTRPLTPGDTIPASHTEPALDLDTLFGGFRPLFRALDPDQVNLLSAELIGALQGQGATIASFLNHAAAVTNALADRDELIGAVIENLNQMLDTFGTENRRFGTAVDKLSELVDGLAARRADIAKAVAHANAAAASVAGLLAEGRKPSKNMLNETNRVATIIHDDREWMDNYLATVPQSYKILSRLGIMGDFFTFYLCDLFLKVNGKGGQPVYIKLAGQDTGRCEPK